jgi:hypothetical protein
LRKPLLCYSRRHRKDIGWTLRSCLAVSNPKIAPSEELVVLAASPDDVALEASSDGVGSAPSEDIVGLEASPDDVGSASSEEGVAILEVSLDDVGSAPSEELAVLASLDDVGSALSDEVVALPDEVGSAPQRRHPTMWVPHHHWTLKSHSQMM